MTDKENAKILNTSNHDEKRGLILDGTKILWHKERVEAWLRGERIAPVTIDMALTRACNYNCEFCYGKLQENPRKKITREIGYRFLDDAAQIGVKAVSLISDGESTVSPIFSDFIEHGSKNGLSMAVASNGYLTTKDKLERILKHLTYFRFNISAGEPKRYSQIMGVPESYFDQVCQNIKDAVEIKKKYNLDVTIGMQMVLKPEYADQVMPLARLGLKLNPDYLVIKHTSDDEKGSLGVDYSKYEELYGLLKEAEKLSTADYTVKVKWSKIQDGDNRIYSRCFGPPFLIQLSGSGLVAPCGMFFGEEYKKYWIGNIVDTPFKKIWESDRYWEVMDYIASPGFDAKSMCGCLCIQHKVNQFLWQLKNDKIEPADPKGARPQHINFI
ncbi:MAG: radical SAM protein [Desulfobacula sp.]|nr:radical SAM protein [Desulfobacula sp.]